MPKQIFSDYVAQWLEIPFKWGTADCICFSIGWASQIAEKNLLIPFGFWENKQEAFLTIKKHGGLTRIFNKLFKRIDPNFAIDGDMAIINSTSYLFVGRFIVGPGDNGLIFKDRTEAKKAWRVIKEK